MDAPQRWQATKPLPSLEEAALHWCAMQSAWTGWWSHLVPLPFANSPLLEMLEITCQRSQWPLNGREDIVPELLVPLWKKPIICSIVCLELQVKYTFPTMFYLSDVYICSIFSSRWLEINAEGHRAVRPITSHNSIKGSHKYKHYQGIIVWM